VIGILIVEDERIVAMALERALRRMGYLVTGITGSGEEAVAKAAQRQPDIVLMDIRLQGGTDGIEAASQIQTRYDIPVVFLTAYADEDTLQRAKVTAAYGYVLKPFQERELRVAIEMALYKHAMERTLKEREHWLAATLSSIGEAVIIADERDLVTFMNPVAETLTGWQQDDAWGKRIAKVLRLEQQPGHVVTTDAIRKACRAGQMVSLTDHLLIAREGARIPVDLSITPIRDEKENSTGFVVVLQDITERKQAEEALRTSEERYRLLFESSPQPILLLGPDGKIVACNSRMTDVIGLPKDDIIGQPLTDLPTMPPEVKARHGRRLARILSGEESPPFTMNVTTLQGKELSLEILVATLKKHRRVHAIQVIGRDITEQGKDRQ